jgi:hypothetical protein
MRRIEKRLLALGLVFCLANPALAQPGTARPRTPNAAPATTNQPMNGPYGGFNAVRPGNPVGTTATGTPSGPYGGANAVRPGSPPVAPSNANATTTPANPQLNGNSNLQFNQFFGGLITAVPVNPTTAQTGNATGVATSGTTQPATTNPPMTGPYGGFSSVFPGNPTATQPRAGGPATTPMPSVIATQPLNTNAQFIRLFGGLSTAVPGTAPLTPGAGVPAIGTGVMNPTPNTGTGTSVPGYNTNGPGVLPNGGNGTGNVPGGTGTLPPARTPPPSNAPSPGNVPR